jgi:hypothetical protein
MFVNRFYALQMLHFAGADTCESCALRFKYLDFEWKDELKRIKMERRWNEMKDYGC